MERLFHIKAARVLEATQPTLAICLGARHCCFSITDIHSGELLQLSYFVAEEIHEPFLTELFSSCPELNISFQQVLVCYDYPESSLVPLKFFRQEDSGLLLETLYGVNADVSVMTEPVEQKQLFNVFAVPREVHERINRRFMSRKYWHRSSLDIKNLDALDGRGILRVDLRRDDFTVVAGGKSQLFLAKTYSYATPSDVIYYLLKICQKFGLSQQEVRIEISGLLDQQSALYREMDQYFLQLRFRNADWNVAPDTEQPYPLHFFTALNDLSKCAS